MTDARASLLAARAQAHAVIATLDAVLESLDELDTIEDAARELATSTEQRQAPARETRPERVRRFGVLVKTDRAPKACRDCPPDSAPHRTAWRIEWRLGRIVFTRDVCSAYLEDAIRTAHMIASTNRLVHREHPHSTGAQSATEERS